MTYIQTNLTGMCPRCGNPEAEVVDEFPIQSDHPSEPDQLVVAYECHKCGTPFTEYYNNFLNNDLVYDGTYFMEENF